MALTATQTTVLAGGIDQDNDGVIDAGDIVVTTVTIANTDPNAAVNSVVFDEGIGTQFNGMTLTGDVNASPLAFDDSYNAIGNTQLSVSAANGLLGGAVAGIHETAGADTEFLGQTIGTGTNDTKVVAGTFTTAHGGTVVINADGSFTYTPATGFTGTGANADSFTYSLRDAGMDGVAGNSDDLTGAGTVTIDVGPAVWYVDNSAGNPGPGTGTAADPFTSIANFNAANAASGPGQPNPGDVIRLHAGTYSEADGFNLTDGQSVIGAGQALTITPTGGGNAVTIEPAGATPVVIVTGAGGQGVQLAQNNSLSGFDIGMNNASAVGIADGGGTVGTLTVSNVGVGVGANSLGSAVDIDQGGTVNIQLNSVHSTSAADGIDLGSTNGLSGTGNGFTVSGTTVIDDATGNGIRIGNSSLNATFTGKVTILNDGSVGDGVDLGTGAGGTNTGTYSFNGGLDIDTTSGTGFVAVNAGTVNITGASNTVDTTTGKILSWNGVNVGSSNVAFNSLHATGTVVGDAILLDNVDGNTFNGGNVTVAGATSGSDGMRISAGSSSTFNFGTVKVDNVGDDGIDIGGQNGAITIASVDLDGMGGAGIELNPTAGTGAININGGSIGSTNDPAGNAVDINGGNGTINIAASITKTTAGDVVEITGRTGGTVTFTGNISANGSAGGIDVNSNTGGTINFNEQVTLSTGATTAVTLAGNTGASINFNSTGNGLDITTTSGTGFSATGGGTVTVSGTGNTIATSAGTALNITSTTIGANDVTFEAISSSGASKGIILNGTGASGGLHVTGSGTTNGSGGTIQNISVNGIELINTADVQLANIALTNASTTSGTSLDLDISAAHGAIYMSGVTGATLNNVDISGTIADNGITGINVSNFTMDNSTIVNAGNAANESGIEFSNLSGTSSISNSSITFSATNSLDIVNTNQNLNLTLNNVQFSDTQFDTAGEGGAASSLGEGGLQFRNFGNGTANIDVLDSDFWNLRTQAIQIIGEDTSTTNVDITNNNIDSLHNFVGVPVAGGPNIGAGIDINGNDNAHVNFNVIGNPLIRSSGGSAVNITSFLGSQVVGRVDNNVITVALIGSGVRAVAQETSHTTIEIKNNTITEDAATNNNSSAISGQARFGSARLDMTIDGNTTSVNESALNDIDIIAGSSAAGETNQVYLDFKNNHASGVAGANDIIFRLRVSDLDGTSDPRVFLHNFVEGGAGVEDDAIATWNAHGNTPTANGARVNVSLTGSATGIQSGSVQTPTNPLPLLAAEGGVPAAQWQLAGIGDFNGDGTTDALVLRADGLLGIASINGSPTTASGILGQLEGGWTIIGVGDIDGDGTTDILLQHEDGTYQANLIHNNTIAGSINLEMVDGQLRSVVDGENAVSPEVPPAEDPDEPSSPIDPVGPAVADPVTSGTVESHLTQGQLDAIVAAAIARLEATGLTAEQSAQLHAVTVNVAEMSGLYLGATAAGHIQIDADAAGYGWYVDAVPMDDAEFANVLATTRLQSEPTGSPAGHIDLLTTIMHELGHQLGLADSYAAPDRDALMYGYLVTGERRLPGEGFADGATPGSIDSEEFLVAPVSIGTLPGGKTVTIQWKATIDAQEDKLITNPVNSGTITSSLGSQQTNIVTTTLDTLTLGNLVFNDVNANGIFDAGDVGVSGVALTLFADTNHNNVFDAGDTQLTTTTTNGSGIYSFTGLAAGDYIVRVDAANFVGVGALTSLPTASGTSSDADTNATDNDNNGTRDVGAAGYSQAITLAFNNEPNAGTGNDTNNTLDFGFKLNNPPTIGNLNGDSSTFTEGGTPVLLDSGTISTLTDGDSPDFDGGSLTVHVSAGGTAAQDVLGISTVGNVTVAANVVSVSGTPIGTITGSGVNGDLVITFNANANTGTVAELLNALTYANSNTTDPSGTTRTISITINDGDSALTSSASVTVGVTPVNDEPTVSANPAGSTFTEGAGSTQGAAVGVFTGAASSTIEAGQSFTSLTFTVSGLQDGANEKVVVGGMVITLGASSAGGPVGGLSYTSTVSSGTATVVITTSPGVNAATINAAINAITYQNTSVDNPTAGDRVFTLTSVQDSGGVGNGGDDTASISVASTVHVVAVNDDATAAVPPPTIVQAEDSSPFVLTPGTLFTDADARSGTVQITVITDDGTLTASSNAVVTASGDGTDTIVLLGTLSDLTTYISGGNISLALPRDFVGTFGLNFYYDDQGNTGTGGATQANTGFVYNITAVNDAPVATIAPASYSGNPGTALDLKNTGLSVSDVDAGAGTVTVTLSVDHGALAVTTGGSGVIVGGTPASVTLTGTLAQINALLNTDGTSTVSFTGTDAINTLTLAIDDGGNTGAGGALADSASVQILLDEPPVVSGTGSTVGYTEQAVGTQLEAVLGLSDADSASLNGATVTISSPVTGDLLAAVTTGTSITASFAAGMLTLTGNDTVANYQQVLRSVTFSSISDDPTSGGATNRIITWTVLDDFNVASTAVTTTVAVTPVNDAPIAIVTPSSYNAIEQTALNLKAGGLAIGDVDAGPAAVVTATLSVGEGTLTVTAGGSGAIVGGGGSSVTLTGTIAQINALLFNDASSIVSYVNGSDNPDPTTLTLGVNDGGATGTSGALTASDSATITFTAINDAPTATLATAAYAASEDVPLNLKNTGISVSDLDDRGAVVTVTLAVTQGVVNVTAGGSGATVSNSGTASVTLSGTLAQINALLGTDATSTVSYVNGVAVPAASATLTLTVNDNGATGTGGALSDSDTSIITIVPANDAPVASITGTYFATEQTTFNLKNNGLLVSDPDAGNGTVTVTLSVGAGRLDITAGGSGAVVSGSGTGSVSISGTIAQISALLNSDATSTVSYFNDSDAPPASTPLTLAVNDGGNSGSGGAKTDTETSVILSGGIGPSGVDDPPTGLDLANEITTLSEAASTNSARKVADIVLLDPDGNTALSLTGADAFLFKIVGDELFLKAGAKIDFETNPKLDVTVNADGAGAHLESSMTISLTDASESIIGTKKSEKLNGTSQSEIIDGRGGNDTIKGNGGNDTIIGGPGADVLTGGSGKDVFKFKSGDLPKLGAFDQTFHLFFGKYDVITDFKPGTDKIDLSSIDANTHKSGNQAFHFEGNHRLPHLRGKLVYRYGEDGEGDRATVVLGDTNGDGSADFRIVLKGHHTLHDSDFIL